MNLWLWILGTMGRAQTLNSPFLALERATMSEVPLLCAECAKPLRVAFIVILCNECLEKAIQTRKAETATRIKIPVPIHP